MAYDSTELAALSRSGGYVEGRLTRLSWLRPAEVWKAFTEAALIAQWLAPGGIEPRMGGGARLDFADSGTVIDSKISAFAEGRMLEFSWSKAGEPLRPVRFTLEPSGVGTRLTLAVLTPDGEDAAKACAGWEAHLDMLEAALEGSPIPFPLDRFKSARDAYRARVAELLAA
jgi:uncharacterized protein YndB with AHSA1/START domain